MFGTRTNLSRVSRHSSAATHALARCVVATALMSLGTACDSTATEPAITPSASTTTRLMVGEATSCAVNSASQMYCWGLNSNLDEYGTPSSVLAGSSSPVNTTAFGYVALSTGRSSHACAILDDGSAKCWGRNSHGQVGGNDVTSQATLPLVVSGGNTWSGISIGRLSTCGVTTAHVAYCWGSNQRGEVGNAARPLNLGSAIPIKVDGALSFKAIAAGWLHTCGITTAGAAYCWGDNTSGQIGIGTPDTVIYHSPVAVQSQLVFQSIVAGANYTCAITVNQLAYCWGQNATGALGDGTTLTRSVPTAVLGGLKFLSIAAGSGFAIGSGLFSPTILPGGASHTCALTTSGTAYCWGWNGAGQLGDGTLVDRLAPTAVVGGFTFTQIALGGGHTCAMRGNGVACWGANVNGQLGNGTTINSRACPVSEDLAILRTGLYSVEV